MGIVVMWLPLTASSRPLSGLHCTDVVLWSLTGNKALAVSRFGDSVTIIAGAYRTARMYVSDGTDASFGRYGSSYRPMRVARGGQQLRGGTLQLCWDALQLCQGTLQLRRDVRGCAWDGLGCAWDVRGCAWDGLGCAWDVLGCVWDGLGCVLG